MFLCKGLKTIFFKRSIFMAVIFTIVILLSSCKVYASDNLKNVLIINSYHPGFPWSDDELNAITKILKDSDLNPNIEIYTEYLDYKRFTSQSHIDSLYADFKEKYSNKKIDIIITSDDAALSFASKNRSEIFSNAPIVFCGVNQLGIGHIIPTCDNITGIIENVDPTPTLDIAYKLNPNIKKVFVLYDSSESGISTAKLTIKAVNTLNKNIEAIPLTNLTKDEIINRVSSLPKDSIIIMTSYQVDKNGDPLDPQQFCREVSSNSTVPVFHLYDYSLNYGNIGGSLLSGTLQGKYCGELALRVLHGENINSIPVTDTTTSRFVFDYNELKHFNLDISKLPQNSEFTNKPFSFFETYKYLVIYTVIIFVILISFIFILIINIKLRKTAEKTLQYKNLELSKLNTEVSLAQENLIENSNELFKKHELLLKSEERYILAIEGSNDAIWDFDVESNHMFVSDRWYDILGYNKDELGSDFQVWRTLIHPEDEEKLNFDNINSFETNNQLFTTEFRLKCKSGHYKWIFIRGKILFNNENSICRISGSMTDITDQKIYEENMYKMAYYDSLTGLSKPALLEKKFQEISRKTIGAIMFFDVDNFKNINDTFGHKFGDKVLIEIGKILQSLSKENIFPSRLGGDEFIIIHSSATSTNNIDSINDTIEQYLNNIMNAFENPINIGNISINITFSIGVTYYPKDGSTFNDLLKNADKALYAAKNKGRRCYVYYTKDMDDQLTIRLEMEKSLRRALDKNEFVLYYQPQIDTSSGKIIGLEALVRWISPEKGMVPPGSFIKLAEEMGLIVELGKEVLKNACIFGAKLQNTMNLNIRTSVNVSAIQLLQEDFVQSVIDTIKLSGIHPENLGIEITETALIEHFDEAILKLHQLTELGIHVHLDDFGTGYSSLNYLKRLPINILKIDKSFIDDIVLEKPEKSITESIISLAHKMNIKVVAEGVEFQEQLEILKKYQCEMIQGYLISKPVPEKDIIILLEKNT